MEKTEKKFSQNLIKVVIYAFNSQPLLLERNHNITDVSVGADRGASGLIYLEPATQTQRSSPGAFKPFTPRIMLIKQPTWKTCDNIVLVVKLQTTL